MKTISVSRKKLLDQYETMKIKDICKYYGICCARLYKIMDEMKIERKIVRGKHREPVIVKCLE